MKNIIVKALTVLLHTLFFSAIVGLIFFLGLIFFSDPLNHVVREDFTVYWVIISIFILLVVTFVTYLIKKDYKTIE